MIAPRPTTGRRKPRLLAAGSRVPATGLAEHYDIHYIGIGYKGPEKAGEMAVYLCSLQGGDIFGVYQAREFVERLQPEPVFLLNDPWLLKEGELLPQPPEPRMNGQG